MFVGIVHTALRTTHAITFWMREKCSPKKRNFRCSADARRKKDDKDIQRIHDETTVRFCFGSRWRIGDVVLQIEVKKGKWLKLRMENNRVNGKSPRSFSWEQFPNAFCVELKLKSQTMSFILISEWTVRATHTHPHKQTNKKSKSDMEKHPEYHHSDADQPFSAIFCHFLSLDWIAHNSHARHTHKGYCCYGYGDNNGECLRAMEWTMTTLYYWLQIIEYVYNSLSMSLYGGYANRCQTQVYGINWIDQRLLLKGKDHFNNEWMNSDKRIIIYIFKNGINRLDLLTMPVISVAIGEYIYLETWTSKAI